MVKQYIVQSNNIEERRNFYNYLVNNGYKPIENFKQQNFINNKFPFVIEHDKTFWICESITCCAVASACGAIISVDEYFNIVKNHEYKFVCKKNIYTRK